MGDLVGDLVPLVLFGWIPIMVYFKHKIRLEEVTAHRRAGNESTLQALQELRREVQDLRETTTRFDMSFDAALTRLEQRVDRVEQRQNAGAGSAEVEAETTVRAGRGIRA